MIMIDPEQKELADYIKSVHLSLRCKSREVGADLAWKEHIENEEVLRKYAICMKNLAENYWSINNRRNEDKCLCRIEWIINTIKEYFIGEGMVKEVKKEKSKMENYIAKSLVDSGELKKYDNLLFEEFKETYRLLDVGSCYNPFNSFHFLETFSIDLFPAIPSVKKCDFTQVRTEIITSNDWFYDGLKIIPKNYFDIVIFSLFLEYLPSPAQRYESCVKAYELLKTNGLLLIATPDSKHESANAAIMKNWKIKLGQIGFVRVKLEKLKYIYCMAFRKSESRSYPAVLYNIRDYELDKVIQIPQDFIEYETVRDLDDNSERNEKEVKETFQELPFL